MAAFDMNQLSTLGAKLADAEKALGEAQGAAETAQTAAQDAAAKANDAATAFTAAHKARLDAVDALIAYGNSLKA